ncbi:MAG: adenylate/guanylate cyclase domain-containing protein [Alphaproteobacteria bacterium]
MAKDFLDRLAQRLFGASAHMPPRVSAEIAKVQEESEVLIGWVQLVGVAFFAVVYTIAPKTFDPNAMFAPVPWTLGFYAGFTLVRLVLAYRRRLPAWMIRASVIIDMAVLLVTIWSFHLQYEQPPGFSLKAPTLLYIFILIALRTLRFDASYVVLAGIAAALGWLTLVAYAVLSTPGPGVITRDYVHYITSPAILIGGEVDKVLSIGAVTAILAISLVRARRLLVRAVAEHAAAADLSRFFAPEVARQITGAEHGIRAGEGELREAAILYLDIRGFTGLARSLPADDVMALLAEYQARMVPVIQSHGGSIDKFLGDGVMATFGAALESERYAADALRAAEALLATADDWNRERAAQGRPALRFGVGVAVGPVVFGAVGDATRLEFTVIGNAVNLAAKLEKHTKKEQVRALVTRTALDCARTQGYAPAEEPDLLEARRVEGVDEPLDLAVLARRARA